MDRSFRSLRIAVNTPRLLLHLVIFLRIRHRNRIGADLSRWAEVYHLRAPIRIIDAALVYLELMTFMPEFRNLFYLRVGLWGRLIAWMCPALDSLQIVSPDIGPGLFIQHGVATLISADRIGSNCWINQHVVIGYSNETDRPTIGNNVRIAAGAKIIGRVAVGDNATIGPNTVVLDNVDPGVTLLGVPGRVAWRSAKPAGR